LLLINNYSKHIQWIFIKVLVVQVCLHAAARSCGLVALATVSSGVVLLAAASEFLGSQLVRDVQLRAGQRATLSGTGLGASPVRAVCC
jgi:hypothetical protein